jgi:regulator of sirC expression with transglutaminase-like and TPR domain
VDPDRLLERLDALAGTVVATTADELCRALFAPGGEIGLRGDRRTYHAPDNSLLDRVLDRRAGIPITLSAVGIEVGRRLGLPLAGIGMPGHFLLADATTGQLFDPFDAGRALTAARARAIFHQLHGSTATFDPGFLAPVSTPAILVRVLNNLSGAHLRRGDRRRAALALSLQAMVPGAEVPARRALADVLVAQGRFAEAADLHDWLGDAEPDAATEHRRAAVRLRARLN